MKGFVYRLPHDRHLDIDREVSTTYCASSTGDSVDLLSTTIRTTMVFSDWCITNLAHGWWVSIQRIVGIIRGGNCSLSVPLWQRSAVINEKLYTHYYDEQHLS